jgi:hypothetical protein
MTKRFMILAGFVCLALLTNLSFRVPTTVDAQAPAVCLNSTAPGFTFGVQKNVPLPGGGVLPDGDLFYLGSTIQFTTQSAGASFFTINPNSAANFGIYPGYANTTSLGFAATTPNATATAVSCLDSFWDIVFEIAGTGATVGDVITLSFQQPGGGGVVNIARFVVQANPQNPAQLGVRVDGLLAGADLSAVGHTPTLVGSFIPFEEAAGTAGQRTRLITIALPMNGTVADCNQLVVAVQRAAGVGTTSVALVNVLVTRNPTSTSTGPGLQAGGTGTFPTGLRCTPAVCPICPVAQPIACDLTICFDAACIWCKRLEFINGRRNFSVTIPNFNFGLPVPVFQGDNLNPFVNQFLRCGSFVPISLRNELVSEYIAAQLSVQYHVPFWFIQLNKQTLACHVTRMLMPGQVRAFPVTLSNGVVLTGNSTLQNLFDAIDWAVTRGTAEDQQKLLNILKQLNNCKRD